MSAAFSFTVVFYDYVITIDDEVNAIWNNPSVRWHSKAVFVANRYVTAAILALVIYRESNIPRSEYGTHWPTARCKFSAGRLRA
jgi:hypothetical protein